MKLHDHIISALRDKSMTLPAIREAVNEATQHAWLEGFFAIQVALLVWRGKILKQGEKFALPDISVA